MNPLDLVDPISEAWTIIAGVVLVVGLLVAAELLTEKDDVDELIERRRDQARRSTRDA